MKKVLTIVLVVALGAVACDSDSDSDPVAAGDDAPCAERSRGQADDFPVTIEAANGEVEIEARPACIVSLSPSSTEILFAVGAGDQVVAVDDQSNFPADAPQTGLSGFTPNVEAVAAYEPDLVVASDDVEGLVDGLERLGVPVVIHPAAQTFDDTYRQIEQLGAATGHADEAAALVGEMKAEIEEIVASLPELDEPPTYYHELDQSLFSVTSQTFIGEVYALAGLENVADAADPDGAAGGYPQLSAEYLVEQDPDVVFLADTKCCDQSAETVAERPGWSDLTAVREGRVVELDDDIASRWGPRVVDFLREVAGAVRALALAGDEAALAA